MRSTGELLSRVLVGTPMIELLKELRRMAGEVKDLKTLKNTLKELNSGAHSAAQQFRDNARDLLETLQLVKGFGSELKEIDGELRQLFGAETNGPPSDEGAS